jgi:hypothetical protein
MSIYHLNVGIICRGANSKQASKATAATAYISGTKIYDELSGKIFDYTNKKEEVVHSTIHIPKNTFDWVKELQKDRQKLWNTVERTETKKSTKPKKAQIARRFIVALPNELNLEQQIVLMDEFSEFLTEYGMIIDYSIHHPPDNPNNPHAHMIVTMRHIEEDGFGNKKRELNHKSVLKEWRQSWAEITNTHLGIAGFNQKITHKSHKDLNNKKIPTVHLGIATTKAKKRGRTLIRSEINSHINEQNEPNNPSSYTPSFFNKETIKKKTLKEIRQSLENTNFSSETKIEQNQKGATNMLTDPQLNFVVIFKDIKYLVSSTRVKLLLWQFGLTSDGELAFYTPDFFDQQGSLERIKKSMNGKVKKSAQHHKSELFKIGVFNNKSRLYFLLSDIFTSEIPTIIDDSTIKGKFDKSSYTVTFNPSNLTNDAKLLALYLAIHHKQIDKVNLLLTNNVINVDSVININSLFTYTPVKDQVEQLIDIVIKTDSIKIILDILNFLIQKLTENIADEKVEIFNSLEGNLHYICKNVCLNLPSKGKEFSNKIVEFVHINFKRTLFKCLEYYELKPIEILNLFSTANCNEYLNLTDFNSIGSYASTLQDHTELKKLTETITQLKNTAEVQALLLYIKIVAFSKSKEGNQTELPLQEILNLFNNLKSVDDRNKKEAFYSISGGKSPIQMAIEHNSDELLLLILQNLEPNAENIDQNKLMTDISRLIATAIRFNQTKLLDQIVHNYLKISLTKKDLFDLLEYSIQSRDTKKIIQITNCLLNSKHNKQETELKTIERLMQYNISTIEVKKEEKIELAKLHNQLSNKYVLLLETDANPENAAPLAQQIESLSIAVETNAPNTYPTTPSTPFYQGTNNQPSTPDWYGKTEYRIFTPPSNESDRGREREMNQTENEDENEDEKKHKNKKSKYEK